MRKIFFDLLEKNNNHQQISADGFSCSFPIEVKDKLRWYRLFIRKKLTGYDIEFTVSHRVSNKIIEHILSDNAITELPKEIQKKFKDCIELAIFGEDN